MNNFEIIKTIENIAHPYFIFNMDDFYGDRGSCKYPKMEEMTTLFFKLDGKNRNLLISKNKQMEIVDKIKMLNLGLENVELINIKSFGTYIVITTMH